MSVEVRKRPSETISLASKRRATVQSTNPTDESGLSQCYKTVSTSLYVSLAPIHLQNPINGIKQQHLDPLIMTYFVKGKGVVVAYSNIKFLEDHNDEDEEESSFRLAKIEGSSPFTFMWISVDFLCWCPQVGDILEGDVYMQTPSHIGLLINDTFNASIKKYNIPSSWTFKSSQVDEVSSDDRKTFGHWIDENETKIEGKLQFTVKAIYTTGRVVSVEGTLIKPGEERNAQPVYTERQEKNASGKHMKFDEEEDVITTEIAEPDENDELPAYVKDSDEEEDKDEDGEVVNKSDSEEDFVESD
ncbi:DNA-directed RNA polymerase I subunit RPA43 [Candida viswanathii]|uniref:DNA-directed RNA polymerase subunit n=1 Tax=Candida viswanathii TaxID=5486 RepID=A0A367Y118_9ASCO|nr:DNA-directed RNA polymerase I subunit RPA43 [Candida viswanathii]